MDHHFDRNGRVHQLAKDTILRLRADTGEPIASGGRGIEVWRRVVGALADPGGAVREIDSRVREVLKILKQDFLAPPKAAELARRVGLSSGRLIHLFSEQMSLPLRRYVLWLRLRDVVLSLAMGHTLTEAAHRAGFADSAHMTRTFRGMFGMPPSRLSRFDTLAPAVTGADLSRYGKGFAWRACMVRVVARDPRTYDPGKYPRCPHPGLE